jgi:hypothetical protein
LSSVVLTPFVGAYYLGGISHGSGPVEALPKRILDEGAWRYVVAADAPWMSCSSFLPCSVGMQHCRILVGLHL